MARRDADRHDRETKRRRRQVEPLAFRCPQRRAASGRSAIGSVNIPVQTSSNLASGPMIPSSTPGTQRQLAERMGTTQSVISRLEQAGRVPTLELLARLAAATGRTYIFSGNVQAARPSMSP